MPIVAHKKFTNVVVDECFESSIDIDGIPRGGKRAGGHPEPPLDLLFFRTGKFAFERRLRHAQRTGIRDPFGVYFPLASIVCIKLIMSSSFHLDSFNELFTAPER